MIGVCKIGKCSNVEQSTCIRNSICDINDENKSMRGDNVNHLESMIPNGTQFAFNGMIAHRTNNKNKQNSTKNVYEKGK